MTIEQWLTQFRVRIDENNISTIRAALASATKAELSSQGDGDTELMRLCALQLFGVGHTEDTTLIWRAKTSSMDADASIDIQLLCGAGLEATKEHLNGLGTQESNEILRRLESSEAAGDFAGFSVDAFFEENEEYYA